jgi:hypothetical protein
LALLAMADMSIEIAQKAAKLVSVNRFVGNYFTQSDTQVN